MAKQSWKAAFAAVLMTGSLAASAGECEQAPVKHTLRDDVRAADVIVLATPRSDSVQAREYMTVDVQKTYKGTPVQTLEIVSECNPAACERACFRAGQPVVLFLERVGEDLLKLRPRYQLRVPAWGPYAVLTDAQGQFVAEVGSRWTAVPAPRMSLRYGEDVVGTAIPIADFERIVAQEAYADREPPLTSRLAYAEGGLGRRP